MDTLAERFDCPIGWSDHTLGIHVALAAVARGAAIVEKHFTVDRTLPGPDHAASLEPEELKALVALTREVESALGSGSKEPNEVERDTAQVARRSLHTSRALPAGTTICEDDLTALRPGTGIPPARTSDVVGRRSRRDMPAGWMIAEADLE
jgi:N-acetylneuraminate synthase/N,N'-diacetyllegionaminate synthase